MIATEPLAVGVTASGGGSQAGPCGTASDARTRIIELTSKEFALLEYLMRNAGRRVTRAMIIEHVWNLSFDNATNLVDVYVAYAVRLGPTWCRSSVVGPMSGAADSRQHEFRSAFQDERDIFGPWVPAGGRIRSRGIIRWN